MTKTKKISCTNGSKKKKIYCDEDDKNCVDDSKQFCNENQKINLFIIISIIIFTPIIIYFLIKYFFFIK
jgi:hypothetical protein